MYDHDRALVILTAAHVVSICNMDTHKPLSRRPFERLTDTGHSTKSPRALTDTQHTPNSLTHTEKGGNLSTCPAGIQPAILNHDGGFTRRPM
jgi:hypothetical protein